MEYTPVRAHGNKACEICGSFEAVHVHNNGERMEDYFLVGRGESDLDAARRWQTRCLIAERILKSLTLPKTPKGPLDPTSALGMAVVDAGTGSGGVSEEILDHIERLHRDTGWQSTHELLVAHGRTPEYKEGM